MRHLQIFIFLILSIWLPQSLKAQQTGIELAWDTSIEADLMHYKLYRGSNTNVNQATMIAIITDRETTFTDTEADLESNHYYWLTAVDSSGNESGYSNRSDYSPSAVGDDPGQLPQNYELGNNFPNPFNSVTIFPYTLPVNSSIRLSIVDISGRELVVLIDSYIPAGHHEVRWEANEFSSGVYFYQLLSGEVLIRKKCLLIK